MSRIGQKKITLPANVKVSVSEAGAVAVEGPKGKLAWTLPAPIKAKVEGAEVAFTRLGESRQEKALHGLSRALVANMVIGVNTGFKRELEIQGVGFKAAVQGSTLNLNLGKSHPILFAIPAEIKITVADNTKITIEGIDNHIVGQCAADIRAFYPPEPYKGKGVRFVGEQIRRKEGKTVQ
ncbi:MAG: 50S ribosomal protein L6 [Terrimicrobiaceae bacterium]